MKEELQSENVEQSFEQTSVPSTPFANFDSKKSTTATSNGVINTCKLSDQLSNTSS